MARIETKKISKEDKAHAIAALTAYKAKNPVKYEAKKDALFERYGLAKSTKITVDVDKDLEAAKEEVDLVTSTPKEVTETKTKKDAK